MAPASLEYDGETGATLVRSSGVYRGFVAPHSSGGWYASLYVPREGRHVWTGGTHVSQRLAVLALGLVGGA